MERFKGLENDILYIRYNEFRRIFIEKLNNDEEDLDVEYLIFLLLLMRDSRNTADKIKEMKEHGRETENSDTEIGRSNNTSDC